MKRVVTLMVVFVVVAVVTAPATATLGVHDDGRAVADADADPVVQSVGQTEPNGTNETNATNASPGQRLAGVVQVQKTEIEGEISQRAFGITVRNLASPDARAEFVATKATSLESRLAALEERKQRLDAMLDNGTISQGEYEARVAELVANATFAKRLTNRTADLATTLPAQTLERNGVDVSRIQRLRENASEMTGPEVSEIARGIAGDDVGNGLGRGPPDHAGPGDGGNGNGPPDDHGNGSNGGPPDDGNVGAGNGSDNGPPDDHGNGSDAGPPDDGNNAGEGNGNGDGNGGGNGPPDDSGGGGDGNGNAGGGDGGTNPGNGNGSDDNSGNGNGGNGTDSGGSGSGDGSSNGGSGNGGDGGTPPGNGGNGDNGGNGNAGNGDNGGNGNAGNGDNGGRSLSVSA